VPHRQRRRQVGHASIILPLHKGLESKYEHPTCHDRRCYGKRGYRTQQEVLLSEAAGVAANGEALGQLLSVHCRRSALQLLVSLHETPSSQFPDKCFADAICLFSKKESEKILQL